VQLQQLLVGLADQTTKTSGQAVAEGDIKQISLQTIMHPQRVVVKPLPKLVHRLLSPDCIHTVVQRILQEKSHGNDIFS
jgi:hypothetical protein